MKNDQRILDFYSELYSETEDMEILFYSRISEKYCEWKEHDRVNLDQLLNGKKNILSDTYFDTVKNEKRHYFFSVNPVDKKVQIKSGKLKEEQILTHGAITALYSDIDLDDYKKNGFKDKADFNNAIKERLRYLKSKQLYPTAINYSGGGYHLYWFLKQPITGKDKMMTAKEIMKRLAKELYGDSVFNLDRVLRVPGSYNVKEKYKIPVKTGIKYFNKNLRYELSDFESRLESKKSNAKKMPPAEKMMEKPGELNINDLKVSDKIKSLILEYEESEHAKDYKSRSEMDFAITIGLLKNSYPDDLIIQLFTNKSFKCSKKALERPQYAEKYIKQNIKNAKVIVQKGWEPDSLKTKILHLKSSNEMSKTFKIIAINEIILNYLLENGKLIIEEDTEELFYYNESLKELFKISHFSSNIISDFDASLLHTFGILKSDLSEVIAFLQTNAKYNNQKFHISLFTKFDSEKNILAVSNFGGSYFHISHENYELKEMDLNNFLFKRDKKFTKVSANLDGNFIRYFKDGFDYDSFKKSLLFEHLISKASLEKEQVLTLENAHKLLVFYFYSMFLRDILPTRPILLFVGEKGSGKTFFGKAIGKLIFGRNFEVNKLPRNESDLRILSKHNPLIVIDNVDTYSRWLQDELSTISTGSVITARKLYTDSDEVTIKPDTFIIATSRNPNTFKRDDIAERTLIFMTGKLTQVVREHLLIKGILDNRNRIWGEILANLKDILSLLSHKENDKSYSFRMADFAFIMDVFLNNDKELNQILEQIKNVEANFTLEDNPIFDAVRDYLSDNSCLYGDAKAISRMIFLDDYENLFKKISTVKLGKWISTHKTELSKFYKVTITKDNSAGKNFYRIERKEGGQVESSDWQY